jgi:DNA-binding response OmpR family regulator
MLSRSPAYVGNRTMSTIAVIEDDADLLELLRHRLSEQGYAVSTLATGIGALSFLQASRPDLILLDVMLPGQDGLDICRAVRANAVLKATPIIFLTARASETDRILGLELGGSDYLVKPFSVRELLARVKIHLGAVHASTDLLEAGPIELNRSQFSVRLNGHAVTLTATEFRLLEHLMTYPGQVFSRSRLLDAVWGHDKDVMERTVDACIVRLRNKVEDEPSNPRWIQSLRGVGYTFRA